MSHILISNLNLHLVNREMRIAGILAKGRATLIPKISPNLFRERITIDQEQLTLILMDSVDIANRRNDSVGALKSLSRFPSWEVTVVLVFFLVSSIQAYLVRGEHLFASCISICSPTRAVDRDWLNQLGQPFRAIVW